jgi:hypothetical protein
MSSGTQSLDTYGPLPLTTNFASVAGFFTFDTDAASTSSTDTSVTFGVGEHEISVTTMVNGSTVQRVFDPANSEARIVYDGPNDALSFFLTADDDGVPFPPSADEYLASALALPSTIEVPSAPSLPEGMDMSSGMDMPYVSNGPSSSSFSESLPPSLPSDAPRVYAFAPSAPPLPAVISRSEPPALVPSHTSSSSVIESAATASERGHVDAGDGANDGDRDDDDGSDDDDDV